jgi:hypothetical protein
MADNVQSNPGTGGPTWATDEIGGVHYSRQKLVHGADGVAVDASPANPLPVVQTGTPALPPGAATDAAVVAVGAAVAVVAGHVDGLEAATGAQADAAAAADGTGNYSVIAAAKRALLNWATLLARVPAAVTPGLLPVDTLATVGVARQLAAGAASANTALTTTARRISIHANGAAIRYAIGTGAQTATATSHYIASGERLDLDVPASAQIAVIRAAATDGVLELSELV